MCMYVYVMARRGDEPDVDWFVAEEATDQWQGRVAGHQRITQAQDRVGWHQLREIYNLAVGETKLSINDVDDLTTEAS